MAWRGRAVSVADSILISSRLDPLSYGLPSFFGYHHRPRSKSTHSLTCSRVLQLGLGAAVTWFLLHSPPSWGEELADSGRELRSGRGVSPTAGFQPGPLWAERAVVNGVGEERERVVCWELWKRLEIGHGG